ncbi:MAG: arylsulfatase [Planctomycetes bacterium]|nr:arylsulfatase [Planctomycetota bacterium]
MMRSTLLVFALGAALCGQTPPRPNLLLIMCDDMGWSDIGCYGGEIPTPSIDRLAREGTRFRQFYNNAKCTTTRASLITGMYPRPEGGLLQQNMVTIAEVLGDAGYRTALSGKWHLGSKAPRRPIDRGFDDAYGLWDGCCNFFDPNQRDPKFKGARVRHFSDNGKRITRFPDGFYTTDAFTDHAIGAVKESVAASKPFFVHVCYTAPHYPLHSFPEDIKRMAGRYAKGWFDLRNERWRRQVEMGLVNSKWTLPATDRRVQPWEKAREYKWQERRMEVYAAMVLRMDQQIGRLLKCLDDTGVAKDTLVMFLSDNGGCAETPGGDDVTREPGPKEWYTHCGPGWAFAQNTPFRRCKSWMHEGGIATPFVARWPAAIPAGKSTDQVGHIIDLLPTCAALAGAKIPTARGEVSLLPIDGKSLVAVLKGGERAGHPRLFWEYARNRAVREGHWKLVWDRAVKEWELYDLHADRTEMHDLAAQHPERVKTLAAAWQAWARRTGVRVR